MKRFVWSCLSAVLVPVAAHAALVATAAQVETPALFDDESGGDADADDPAIWVHPTQPGASLVIGTKKNAGLDVYTLGGRRLQAVAAPPAPGEEDEPGRFNNVDLLYRVALGGRRVDVAVVTDRGRDHIRFYRIDPVRAALGLAPLVDVTDPGVPFVFSASQAEVNEQTTAYGIAATTHRGQPYVLASRRSRTEVALLRVFATPAGRLTYTRTRSLRLPNVFHLPNGHSWTPCQEDDHDLAQVEGMVVDEASGTLFMGQEKVGLWRLDLWRSGARPRLVDKAREYGVPYDRLFDPEEEEHACEPRFDRDPGFGGKNLSADVEGLTISVGVDGDGYLLASSQGDSTFAVYSRRGTRYIGSFRIVDGRVADGVQHSDGAAVVNVPLGRRFPKGLFVTQDGDNTPAVLDQEGEARPSTNFKLVPWESVARAFNPPLDVDVKRIERAGPQ